MGSPANELGRDDDEPQHEVSLERAFFIKVTEVTQGEWLAVMGNNPSGFPSCGADCPVEYVTWWDALAYCNALSTREGLEPCYALTGCTGVPGERFSFGCTSVTFAGLSCRGYRLPTEAEWEYAARAGSTDAFYTGPFTTFDPMTGCTFDSNLDRAAWVCFNRVGGATHPVCGKEPNAWGLCDVLGNVAEWVWDWYGPYPGFVRDYAGPTSGSNRVIRGGTFSSFPRGARAAERERLEPTDSDNNMGLRPCRTVP